MKGCQTIRGSIEGILLSYTPSESRTRRFFQKKSQFGYRAHFVSKLGQNQDFLHSERNGSNDFAQILTISTTFVLTPRPSDVPIFFYKQFFIKIFSFSAFSQKF